MTDKNSKYTKDLQEQLFPCESMHNFIKNYEMGNIDIYYKNHPLFIKRNKLPHIANNKPLT